MRHNYIKNDNSGDHWATNTNSYGCVLVQLQGDGEQVRVILNIEQAEDFAQRLLRVIQKAKNEETREEAFKRLGLKI